MGQNDSYHASLKVWTVNVRRRETPVATAGFRSWELGLGPTFLAASIGGRISEITSVKVMGRTSGVLLNMEVGTR